MGKSLYDDEGDELHWLVCFVLQTVGGAVACGADVSGVDQDLLAIVVEHGLALDDVIKLRLVLVVVIADGAAGVHRGMGEHPPVAVQPLLVGQFLNVDEALALPDADVLPGAVFSNQRQGASVIQ